MRALDAAGRSQREPHARADFGAALVDDLDGPLPALLLALTVLAGIVDATSILRLGHVFCATVTGNLVFLGLAGAGVTGFDVATPAVALGGFVIGALVGGHACRAAGSHRGLAVRNVLAIKAVLATAVTIAAFVTGGHFSLGVQDALLVLLAISMGTPARPDPLPQGPGPGHRLPHLHHHRRPDRTRQGLGRPRAYVRRGLAIIAFTVGAMVGSAAHPPR